MSVDFQRITEPSEAERLPARFDFGAGPSALQIIPILLADFRDMLSAFDEILARRLQDPSGDYVMDLPTMEQDPMRQAYSLEKSAFERLLPGLLREYQGRYVAVSGGAVVDADTDKVALVQRFFARHGDSPVFVGYVSTDDRPSLAVTPFRR